MTQAVDSAAAAASLGGDVGLAQVVARHLHEEPMPAAGPVTPPFLEVVEGFVGADDVDADVEAEPSDEVGLSELLRRANHDELTGLANRSWFINAVDSKRGTVAEPGALFIIDLDGFKSINDTWGHNEGDTVLQEVSRRLETIALPPALAARLGGDEFALFIPNCRPAQASLIADRIISLVSEPVSGALLLTVGASVGWVTCDDDTPASALMSRADTALYAVKERGGHGHQEFNQELASARLQGRILQREIRHAMDVGQFCTAVQPILNIHGGSAGAEVLSRWRHPRRGLLQPGEFLPAIAAAGSNATFDTHVIDRVLTRVASAGDCLIGHLPLWLNLSSECLNMRFVTWMSERIDTLGLDPTDFVVEVSEHASAESAQATSAIEALAEIGLAIAIDDFGSGYSRLAAMKRLPISFVKIDRAFTTGLDTDDRSRAVTTAIVGLIRALGAEPVAEGIERQEDANVMAQLGCNLMQGFLWDRPAILDVRTEPVTATPC